MNTVKLNNKLTKAEGLWRGVKTSKQYDNYNKLLPFPKIEKNSWNNKNYFLRKIKQVELYAFNHETYLKKKSVKCVLCHKKINGDMYQIGNMAWFRNLHHYIKAHNVTPTNEFTDYIFSFDLNKTMKKTVIKGDVIISKKKKYIQLKKNQLLILDALLEHGSKKNYDNKYSEHAGAIDFNMNKIDKIVVNGNTNILNNDVPDIYLPDDVSNIKDYEYIFHTHPYNSKIGDRLHYEFPSIDDILYYIDYYNKYKLQGSLIMAPEGLYMMRKIKFDNKKIRYNETSLNKKIQDTYNEIQFKSVKKYGKNVTKKLFYEKIAQKTTHLTKINKVLTRYGIELKLFGRVKINNKWIVNNIYLPVYPIEYRKK